MGKGTTKNFQDRFGDRINVVYPDKPLSATERVLQYEAISKAVFQVMTGILGREPTREEFLGIADISKLKHRRRT